MLALHRPSSGPVLGFGVDTFAFRNDSRIHHRGKPDIYCNRCFLMARAVGRFQRFARFEPEVPRLRAADYAERVRQVTRRAAWRTSLPPERRVVFPGFASLHALGREEEAAAQAGLAGAVLDARALDELADARIALNHSVTAFDYRAKGPEAVEFVVYDPKDPAAPGVVRLDRRDHRFHPASLCGVSIADFRAFRQYYSPFF